MWKITVIVHFFRGLTTIISVALISMKIWYKLRILNVEGIYIYIYIYMYIYIHSVCVCLSHAQHCNNLVTTARLALGFSGMYS